jgi:hypothetical protein
MKTLDDYHYEPRKVGFVEEALNNFTHEYFIKYNYIEALTTIQGELYSAKPRKEQHLKNKLLIVIYFSNLGFWWWIAQIFLPQFQKNIYPYISTLKAKETLNWNFTSIFILWFFHSRCLNRIDLLTNSGYSSSSIWAILPRLDHNYLKFCSSKESDL